MPGLKEFYASLPPSRRRGAAVLIVAIAAGTLSTVVQVILWLLFTDTWPAILFRDARLAAAIVMGPSVLPPPATFDAGVMLVATVVHFGLSIAYAAFVAAIVGPRPLPIALVLGAALGVALYAVNMHGFTRVFPWFAQARDPITVAAHVAFGLVAAAAWAAARPVPDA
jgi:hypothetical protein